MMPSCVPATEFEDNGAKLKGEDLKVFKNNKEVLGLGEVMDVFSAVNFKEDMIEKIDIYSDKKIDGHCPLVDEKNLNAYILLGISTDHECSSINEALDKIKRGMYVMIRKAPQQGI